MPENEKGVRNVPKRGKHCGRLYPVKQIVIPLIRLTLVTGERLY